jgi:hypothetical protein
MPIIQGKSILTYLTTPISRTLCTPSHTPFTPITSQIKILRTGVAVGNIPPITLNTSNQTLETHSLK